MSNQSSNSAATDERVKPSAKRGGKKKPFTIEHRYVGGNDVWLKYFPNADKWSTYNRYADFTGAVMAINSIRASEFSLFGCRLEYRILDSNGEMRPS